MYKKDEKLLKNGDAGEAIVIEILKDLGYHVVRGPGDGAEGHPYDIFVYTKEEAYKNFKFFFCEVKTKPRRWKVADTGIDNWQFKKCNNLLKQGIDTLIMFVDEIEKSVYGEYFSNLLKNYKREKYENGAEIIYFKLETLKVYRKLTEDELKMLSSASKTVGG